MSKDQEITIKSVEAPAFKDLSAMLTPRLSLVVEYKKLTRHSRLLPACRCAIISQLWQCKACWLNQTEQRCHPT